MIVDLLNIRSASIDRAFRDLYRNPPPGGLVIPGLPGVDIDGGNRVTPDSLSLLAEPTSPLLLPPELRLGALEESLPSKPKTRLKPEALNVKLERDDLIEFSPSFANEWFVSEGDTGEYDDGGWDLSLADMRFLLQFEYTVTVY